MKSNARVFVTGGDGFVGTHLAAHLRSWADEVTVVGRECDVTDRSALAAAVREARPDVIYHLAALTSVAASWKHPEEYTRVNVVGTKHLLDVAREFAAEATVVVVSSAEVYGIVDASDLPLRESVRTSPENPYSSSKVEAEHFALDAARHGQRVIIARPFNHIGPGQSAEFVIPALASRLLRAVAQGTREIAVGNLSARRDFSDVRDVVRAYRLLASMGESGQIYNVASGHDVALADVAALLRDEIAPSCEFVVDPALVRPVDVPVLRGSFEKLHDATGWEPAFSLQESLRDVVADLRARAA